MITDEPFQAFGLSHGVAVVALISLGVCVCKVVRNNPTGDFLLIRYVLAGVLFYSALSGIVNALLRYSRETAWEMVLATELPFFLCDVVAVILGCALIWRSQRLTEVGYLWAMAGTAQGLITPELNFDWPSLEYISFFAQHGLAPIAAVVLIWGMQLKPQPGAYLRVWLWLWGYVASVIGINFLLGTNYGFLNAKPMAGTALDYLGPYPWYLLSLHAVAALLFFLLLLPFRREIMLERNTQN